MERIRTYPEDYISNGYKSNAYLEALHYAKPLKEALNELKIILGLSKKPALQDVMFLATEKHHAGKSFTLVPFISFERLKQLEENEQERREAYLKYLDTQKHNTQKRIVQEKDVQGVYWRWATLYIGRHGKKVFKKEYTVFNGKLSQLHKSNRDKFISLNDEQFNVAKSVLDKTPYAKYDVDIYASSFDSLEEATLKFED